MPSVLHPYQFEWHSGQGQLFDNTRYHGAPQTNQRAPRPDLTLLHRTSDPHFNLDPDHGPRDVGQQGGRFFGTRTSRGLNRWSNWAEDRAYVAKVTVPQAEEASADDDLDAPGDYWKGRYGDETLLSESGVAKAKVDRVSPSRIYRGHDEKDIHPAGGPGPTGNVKLPRQPRLPGMEGTRGKAPVAVTPYRQPFTDNRTQK